MCGIWALIQASKEYEARWYSAFQLLSHRGPDYSSFEAYSNVLVGFHRLAIIDDTFSSNQPFVVENDTSTVVFLCNGEIYNYRELIETFHLPPIKNDCRVLLELYMKLLRAGQTEDFSSRLRHHVKGEYAFVLLEFDRLKNLRRVVAGRDEIGVRPLYVSAVPDVLLFTSELKGAVGYEGEMIEFPPGTTRTYYFNELGLKGMEATSHSRVYDVVSHPATQEAHINRVRTAVMNSVRRRLCADKPIAWLLSGGVDSSLVAALSAKMLDKPIRTFCCGMRDGTDLQYARMVAQHIGSNHTEVYFTEEEGLDAIHDVIRTVESWDTTTVRASVGQYIVSSHIGSSTDCKVVMVGEGPDEVCSSYLFNWYAPNGAALDASAKDYVKNIHYYDVKRADRCIARWGLEGRVPLLDPEFIRAYWAIPGEERMPTHKKMEKWWLREAFSGTDLLPEAVLWRKKEAFSDGVSGEKSWFQVIQEWVENKVTAEEMATAATTYPYCTPQTKEAYYYRKVFCDIFGSGRQTVIPGYWQPKWSANGEVTGYIDPSARVLGVYNE